MSLLLWRALRSEERLHLERTVTAEAKLINEELVARMEPRVLSLVRLSARWGTELGASSTPATSGRVSVQRREWEMEAALNLSHFPGNEGVFLVTPDRQFRWRVPPLQDAPTSPSEQEGVALETARERRTPRLTGPMALGSGVRGFRAYVPVFQGRRFLGWVAGAFQHRGLFDHILNDLATGYDLEIAHAGETVYRQRAAGEELSVQPEARSRIELYGSPFVIRIRPGPAVISAVMSPLPQVVLSGGILVSLLFGLALHYAQKADRRSRVLAAERRRLKRSEAELARSRDYYLILLERFPALIWRSDSNAWCDYHNQTWLDFTGRTFEEEQGSGWTESVHPDDLDLCMQNFMAAFNARAPFEMEYRLRHHTGEYRPVSDRARPIYDLEGRFAGYLGACFDLSQREEALAALRESEEVFRTVFETAPVGISRVDHEGRFVTANDVYLQMLGYSEEELRGLNVEQITHPDDWPRDRELFQRLIHKEIPSFEIQKRFLRKDGSEVWVHNSVSAVFDPAGRPLFVHTITQDITEQRRNREELERREILLRDAQDLARMGSWEWDLRSERVEWSDTEFRLFGLAPGSIDLTYANFLALVHPDDHEMVKDDVRRTMELGESDTIFRILRSDGSVRWLESRRRLMRDEAGEPVRMIGTTHDITEMKEAEESLRESEKRYRSLVSNIPGAVFRSQVDRAPWRMRFMSDPVLEITGYPPSEFVGKGRAWTSIIHPDDIERVANAMAGVVARNEPFDLEYRVLHRNGSTRWVHDHGRVVYDEAGKPSVAEGVVTDITERKTAEEAVRVLAEAGIAFGASLDFRQVLSAVAKLAVPALADFCFFDALTDVGEIERFALLHRDPAKQDLLEQTMDFAPTLEFTNHPVVKAIRSGEPELVSIVDEAWRKDSAMNAEDARLIRAMGVISLLTLPVEVRGRILGALTLTRTADSGRRFDRRELPLFEELARRAGVALENARLHEELRNREAHLAEAQAIAHLGRWDRDLRNDRAHWTDEVYRIFGLEPGSENSSADLIQRFHPDDLERAKRIVMDARETGEPFELEARIVRPDGTPRVIHAVGQSEKDADGRVIRQFGTCQDVTELRRAEEALEASEEKYRILAERSADLITQQAPDGEILYVSPAIESMFGYTPEEVVGRNGREFILPADLEKIESLRLALLHGEPAVTVIFRMRNKSGEYRWVETTAQTVADPGSDRFDSVISVTRDITDTIAAAKRDRLLQAITAVANEAGAVGPALRLTLEKICEHTGWAVGHVAIADQKTGGIGSIDIWQLPESEQLAAFRASIEQIPALAGEGLPGRVLSSGRAEWVEDLHANGEALAPGKGAFQRIRSAFAFPIHSGERTLAVLQFFSREPRPRDEPFIEVMEEIGVQLGEMIQRLRTKAALAASEMRFRALSESAHDAIFTMDSEGAILYCNESSTRIFGYECDDLLGRPFISLLSDHTPERRSEAGAFAQLMKARDPSLMGRTVELTGRRRDGGDVPIELALSWWEAEEGVYFTVILRDITARKRTEERLQENMSQLARSNAELGLFTYVASHDLREPLRTVASNVQLMKRRLGDKIDPTIRKEMEFAVDGVGRMQALLHDLLTYSRVGTDGKPFAWVEAETVLAETVQSLGAAIEEHAVEIRHEPLPTVFGDRSQLAQLFLNLLSNAIKFHDNRTPRIRVWAERKGAEWVFSVRDNGIGIDPAYADHIFTVFQRLHSSEEYPGTGIGLAVCRKIVERHRGRIWVESERGAGSTFRFTIPDPPNGERVPQA